MTETATSTHCTLLGQTKMIVLHNERSEIPFSSFKFSGGETNVKVLEPSAIGDVVYIKADINSGDDVMELLLLTDAIRRINSVAKIGLLLPYLPYSRQDRVMVTGESLSIKVFASIINAQNYDSVVTWDAHSDVGVALIDRCTNLSQYELVDLLNLRLDAEDTILVSPDAGAEKKIFAFAKALNFNTVVRASKTRDVSTGQITRTELMISATEKGTYKDFLIVDDICDGGRTFIELAKVLRPHTTGKIMLLVTHGIFSKGIEVFDGIIDEVFVLNNIGKVASAGQVRVHSV